MWAGDAPSVNALNAMLSVGQRVKDEIHHLPRIVIFPK